MRGGGGNFGVVTSFEYRLHPVGRRSSAACCIYPLDGAGEVLRFYRDFTRTAPDELGDLAALTTAPGRRDRSCALVVCYNGAVDEGERVLAPLRAFGPPIADLVEPMPYAAMQTHARRGVSAGPAATGGRTS